MVKDQILRFIDLLAYKNVIVEGFYKKKLNWVFGAPEPLSLLDPSF